MSNFLAVATVTAALRLMLQGPAETDVPGALVSTERPDTRQNGAAGPGVNIFLYQVMPNAALRNADLPTRGTGGQLVRRPQVALDLHYLLSCYGDDAQLEPQRLFGSMMRTLHARPVLTPDVTKAVVDAASATPPIHPALRDSDLADQVELVKLALARRAPVPCSCRSSSRHGPGLPNVSPAPNWAVVPGQRCTGDNSETGRATENGVKPNLLTCGNALLWGWGHVRELRASEAVSTTQWSRHRDHDPRSDDPEPDPGACPVPSRHQRADLGLGGRAHTGQPHCGPRGLGL